MDVVGIGRIEEEERGGGWSYSTTWVLFMRERDKRTGG
jgi:hypothetical protein